MTKTEALFVERSGLRLKCLRIRLGYSLTGTTSSSLHSRLGVYWSGSQFPNPFGVVGMAARLPVALAASFCFVLAGFVCS